MTLIYEGNAIICVEIRYRINPLAARMIEVRG